jgi:hypothetical protein
MIGEEAADELRRAEIYGDEDYGDPEAPPAREPVIGDNKPPTVKEQIALDHADLLKRVEALKEQAKTVPAEIKTAEDLEMAALFIKSAREVGADVKTTHAKVKAPYKEGTDAADEIFLTRGATGTIEALMKSVKLASDAYQTRIENERREALRQEAIKAEEAAQARLAEAAKLTEEGHHRVADVVATQAQVLEDQAAQTAAKAEGKVGDIVRTTTYAGVTVGGTKKWVGDITDPAKIDLNKLRDVIQGHELVQFVNRFVDRGGRELEGVNIHEKTISTFR